tara:strand:+ start:227 stop:640 length:414 start_codon:yes stop_codon:yes gene_type:complete
MKLNILLLFYFAICQSHDGFFNLNQSYEKNFKKFFNNFKDKNILSLNHGLLYNDLNWFYATGPYHDIWGADILSFGKYPTSGSIFYNPFGNSILSLRSCYQKNKIDEALVIYINFFGLNLKKTNYEDHLDQFFGSEK